MYENNTDTNLDLRKVIKSIAQMNPHVPLSDIAFLMDAPYESEIYEYDIADTMEDF